MYINSIPTIDINISVPCIDIFLVHLLLTYIYAAVTNRFEVTLDQRYRQQ